MRSFKFLNSNYPTKKDLDTAYMNGYTHYLEGRDRTYNPYFDSETYGMWNQGWRWAHIINVMDKLATQNEQI